jgi:hypothetical protein
MRTSSKVTLFLMVSMVLGALPTNVAAATLGADWTEATPNAGWGVRGGHSSAVYEDKLWVMGGWNGSLPRLNDVWHTTDGATWTQASAPTGWGRTEHTSTVFDGKLWLMGGADNSGRRNDVWYTTDGVNWTEATAAADWSIRYEHASAVYDGKLWVMGGYSDPINRNDVWHTTDGVNWTQATAAAGWSARGQLTSAVYDGKLWILGGVGAGGARVNDVWYTTDGASWTQATAAAPWSARDSHTSAVYDGKLWVIGGNDGGALNDVWYTTDGVNWSEASSAGVWSARYAHTSVVYDGRLWVVGGDEGSSSYINDAWYSTSFSSDVAPTALAGPDQRAVPGDTVYLDGSASFDDNTDTASLDYSWTLTWLPAGSAADLTGGDTVTPSFVVDVAGTYVVELVVTDSLGQPSAPDEVVISSSNLAPTAVATVDSSIVLVGDTVTFDGTESTDPEDDARSYAWSITSAPPGSTAILSDATAAGPTLTPDMEGDYEVTLTVSDLFGPGAPASVAVTATNAESLAEFLLVAAGEVIADLPTSDVTTKGNQKALQNFLRQAIACIQEGDIDDAIEKIESALKRTDGCVLRGAPDGNGRGRDWVTNCTEQEEIYDLLVQALDALTL